MGRIALQLQRQPAEHRPERQPGGEGEGRAEGGPLAAIARAKAQQGHVGGAGQGAGADPGQHPRQQERPEGVRQREQQGAPSTASRAGRIMARRSLTLPARLPTPNREISTPPA